MTAALKGGYDAAFRCRFPHCGNIFALARACDCGLRCRDPTLDMMVSSVVASSDKRFVLEPGWRLGETKTGRRYGLSTHLN